MATLSIEFHPRSWDMCRVILLDKRCNCSAPLHLGLDRHLLPPGTGCSSQAHTSQPTVASVGLHFSTAKGGSARLLSFLLNTPLMGGRMKFGALNFGNTLASCEPASPVSHRRARANVENSSSESQTKPTSKISSQFLSVTGPQFYTLIV